MPDFEEDDGEESRESSPEPLIIRPKKVKQSGDSKDDKPVSMRSLRKHEVDSYSGSYTMVGQFPVFRW